VEEIDQDLLDYPRHASYTEESEPIFFSKQQTSSYNQYKQPANASVSSKAATGGEKEGWKAGDRVQHKKWGVGTVVRVNGTAKDLELDVAFPNQGVKRLLAAFAPIEKV
jgi:DNA helicase-2/ATP-dependent DNA helicase PcrA